MLTPEFEYVCPTCALVLGQEYFSSTLTYDGITQNHTRINLWKEWCLKTHQSREQIFAIDKIFKTQLFHLKGVNLRHRYSIAFYLNTLQNNYPLELGQLAEITGCKVKMLAICLRCLNENTITGSQPLIFEHSRLFLQNMGLSKICQKNILQTCRRTVAFSNHLVQWKPLIAACILLHICQNSVCQNLRDRKNLCDILGCTLYSLQKMLQQIKKIDPKEFSAPP